MAEVGLVTFARVCLQVAKRAVPAHRSKFSKRQFTQPQLLTVLCLMRYEDWTFREAEVRLAEHSELRKAIGLKEVPDHTTLYRFFRRLDERMTGGLLAEVERRFGPHPDRPTDAMLAVDATGLQPGAMSTYFVKRLKDGGRELPRRHWLKWLVALDVDRFLILAQKAHPGPINDSATLRPLVDEAATLATVGSVTADGEFDSERNHLHIRHEIGAMSVIPAKRGKKTWRIHGFRAQMRRRFPRKLYGRRSLVESLFSAIKRKLSAKAPGRSWVTQRMQALLLGVAFNVYRLRHAFLAPPMAA